MPPSDVADAMDTASIEEGFKETISDWRGTEPPRRRASDKFPQTSEELEEIRQHERQVRRAELSKKSAEIRSIQTESRIKSALSIGICTLCALGGVLVAMAVTPPKR